jgi:Linalool dehydratase/isomerase
MTVHRIIRVAPVASAIWKVMSPFLAINSTIQSYLHKMGVRTHRGTTPHFRKQQARCLGGYGAIVVASTIAGMSGQFSELTQAVMLGVGLPGAGFLHWASGDQVLLAIGCMLIALLCFAASLVVWFATGNVLAPVVSWALLSWLASRPELVGLEHVPAPSAWTFALAPALWGVLGLVWIKPTKALAPQSISLATVRTWAAPTELPIELSVEDLQRQRLLLDRALQPVKEFEGFEWRDQFQTAAVRYQVNFMAYALAIAQHRYTPAAEGYLAEAQQRLLVKIGDKRLWRYWQIENAWGRLRLGADPVPDQNIMYSGFTALQMALSGHDSDLVLHDKGCEWRRYSLDDMATLLERQYQASPYGLLACEPNWIYPLCNLITATGIKAADPRTRADRWQGIATSFRESLEREGTRVDGSFIAFRSALTGIAPPAPGGIVMQAFPCLFLNCLDPDLAQEHWHRVRGRLARQNWRRLFWPVDVGNYGFSRASSYAATAAAAVELGDAGIAQECLQRLEAECPSRCEGSVIHHDHASLWAHALELIARCGGQDGLRELAGHSQRKSGPRLVKADYPDVLVARAHARGGILELVLYPGGSSAAPIIELGGLMPECHYHTGRSDQPFLRTDCAGRALVKVPLHGRTCLTIKPVV